MLVQRFAGVAAEPVIAEPGEDAILEAAAGAGLLVVGLSDRWRQEGLGPTRSELAERRARADPLRPPRRARRRARPARGRHALHLVVAEHRERRPGDTAHAGVVIGVTGATGAPRRPRRRAGSPSAGSSSD